MKLISLALFFVASTSFSAVQVKNPSSFSVRTTSGALVQVSPTDLAVAYSQMIASITNNIQKMTTVRLQLIIRA